MVNCASIGLTHAINGNENSCSISFSKEMLFMKSLILNKLIHFATLDTLTRIETHTKFENSFNILFKHGFLYINRLTTDP